MPANFPFLRFDDTDLQCSYTIQEDVPVFSEIISPETIKDSKAIEDVFPVGRLIAPNEPLDEMAFIALQIQTLNLPETGDFTILYNRLTPLESTEDLLCCLSEEKSHVESMFFTEMYIIHALSTCEQFLLEKAAAAKG